VTGTLLVTVDVDYPLSAYGHPALRALTYLSPWDLGGIPFHVDAAVRHSTIRYVARVSEWLNPATVADLSRPYPYTGGQNV